MSGGISFSKDVYWGKAGWCYRAARDAICAELRVMPDGHALAAELSAESHPAQYCEYLEIDDWPAAKKKLLFEAIFLCAARVAKEGPVGWHDPTFFPGFLRAMEELVEMTHAMQAKNEKA